MADEYQGLRDLHSNGAGGAGTGLAVVYLWMRYGRAWSTGGQTGLTAAEARSFIEEQRERLRNWFDEARMRIRDLEVTMDKIEETQEKLLAVSNQTVNEQRTQTEIQRPRVRIQCTRSASRTARTPPTAPAMIASSTSPMPVAVSHSTARG